MKVINSIPIFNFINNGFMYLCEADDGTYWLRSVAGKWVQIKTSTPFGLDEIEADLQTFIKLGGQVTENDVKVDNSSQTVVDPVKVALPIQDVLADQPI